MIRQAISCDICGTEKKQTNHWFVARESGGELHIGGWGSRNRNRPGSKHLCGQTCLHKLVDEFMARLISARATPSAEAVEAETESKSAPVDASLTSVAAHGDVESSARLLAPAMRVRSSAPPALHLQAAGPVVVPAPVPVEVASSEVPIYSSSAWRAEAWERERERELRSGERQTDFAARRR